MKTVSKFLATIAVALAAVVVASPAHALQFEYTYPDQHEIEARQVKPAHPLFSDTRTTYYEHCEDEADATKLATVVHFPSGGDKLSPMSAKHVRKLAHMLKSPAYRGKHVVVNGYSDSSGKPAANERLSYHRALNVMHALIADGVPGSMLSAQGFGADKPVATNSTKEGRALNRRVTFTVVTPRRDRE